MDEDHLTWDMDKIHTTQNELLHLLELVDTERAPSILAVRASLATAGGQC